jgi:uncharacterized protein with FMN-binding domain
MRRILILLGGAIGSLGSVLLITPMQLTSATQLPGGIPNLEPGTQPNSQSSLQPETSNPGTSEVQPKPTKGVTTKPNTKPNTAPSTPGQPETPLTPTPVQTVTKVSGSFTGDPYSMKYGTVQVKITVQNGKITDAVIVQAPSGSSDSYTQRVVPKLREQTITAQSANIQGVSGASFTSYGWYQSLASAISKAGL